MVNTPRGEGCSFCDRSLEYNFKILLKMYFQRFLDNSLGEFIGHWCKNKYLYITTKLKIFLSIYLFLETKPYTETEWNLNVEVVPWLTSYDK